MNQVSRYKELDALRGIAALMVVFFHFTWGRPDSNFYFRVGDMGVDLFFIISGFVIFMSLSKIKTSKEFIINRFCRLYPTYWACLTLTFILINIYYHYTIIDFPKLHFSDFLGNLTMFQFYLGLPHVDDSYWTLTIELLFYIFMVILFRAQLLKHIDSIGILVIFILVSLATFFQNESVKDIFKWVPLLLYFPLFFAGIQFYKIYSGETKQVKNHVLILLAFTAQFFMHDATGRNIFITTPIYGLTLGVFMLVFLILSWHKLNFIAIKPLVFFGKISFALYLIHTFISINLLYPFFVDYLGFNYWLSTFLFILPILIGLASLITYFIEIPLQSLLKRKLQDRFLKPREV